MTNLCVCVCVCVFVLSRLLLFRFSVSSFLASFLVEGFLVINLEEKKWPPPPPPPPPFSSPVFPVLLHLRSSVSSRIKIQAITTRLERVLVGRAGHDRAKPARRREERRDAEHRGATKTVKLRVPSLGSVDPLSRITRYPWEEVALARHGPRMRSRNIRRGGVGCHGLYSLSLFRSPPSFTTLLFPLSVSPSLRLSLDLSSLPPLFSSPPLLPPSSLAAASWHLFLTMDPNPFGDSGIHVYAGKSIKEGSTHSKRSARDRPWHRSYDRDEHRVIKWPARPFSYALRNWRYVARHYLRYVHTYTPLDVYRDELLVSFTAGLRCFPRIEYHFGEEDWQKLVFSAASNYPLPRRLSNFLFLRFVRRIRSAIGRFQGRADRCAAIVRYQLVAEDRSSRYTTTDAR